jgi:2-methylcitrate dehydratase PrpD
MAGLTDNASIAALETLARRVASARWEALDEATRTVARQRLFDALGALVVGLATPEGGILRRYADLASGDGRTLDAGERCRLYVGATRATEVDDIDVASCTTVGSVVVPAALTVASTAPGRDSRALLTAVVSGYEAMLRLGRAIGGASLLYRGVWPTYVSAAFGAAAATARLLDLDAAVTAHALALALVRTAPLPSAGLSTLRYYALGCAAAEGADAAFAAAGGVMADLRALAGFAERCGASVDAAALQASDAEPWLIQEVDTKTWPTSRQALASVAAFRTLEVRADELDSIERIDVFVPAAYRDMVDRPRLPAGRVDSMVGVQYQLALAVHDAGRLHDALRSPLPSGELLEPAMAKVVVHADVRLSGLFPRRWGGRVVLRYRSGAERTAEVVEPEGSAARPLDWSGLREKYHRIFSASDVARQGWVGVTSGRCERAGAHGGDVSFATDLLASAG